MLYIIGLNKCHLDYNLIIMKVNSIYLERKYGIDTLYKVKVLLDIERECYPILPD